MIKNCLKWIEKRRFFACFGGLVGAREALVALTFQSEGDRRPIRLSPRALSQKSHLLGLQTSEGTKIDEGVGHGIRLFYLSSLESKSSLKSLVKRHALPICFGK